MMAELKLSARLEVHERNEGTDEVVVQMYFLTYDGDEPTVQVAHTEFAVHFDASPSNPSHSIAGFSPQVPETIVIDADAGLSSTYVCVVIRILEWDNSSTLARTGDVDAIVSILESMEPRPAALEALARVNAITPQDETGNDDDLIKVGAFTVEYPYQFGPQQRVVWSSDPDEGDYRVSDVGLIPVAARGRGDLNAAAEGIRDDDDAREFIRRTNTLDLAALGVSGANNLLEELFSGTTAGEDELAIIDLVSALPTSTVQELETAFGRDIDSYEAEVDGANFTRLRSILARSIDVGDS